MMTAQSVQIPESIPKITGTLLPLVRFVSRPQAFFTRMREKHGDIIALRVPERPCVVFLSPAGAQAVFTVAPSSLGAFWKEPFEGLAGSGSLWVLEGQRHRQERKLLSPAFQPGNYRQYGESIRAIVRARTASWSPGLELRAIDEMLAISMDVILRVVFGVVERDLLDQGRAVNQALLKEAHPSIIFFPFLQANWFPGWRRFVRAKRASEDWVQKIIDLRRRERNDSGDVLGRMLAASYEDGTVMCDEDIRDELLTILMAGHETTATALSWALYELSRNPTVLNRLREEVGTLGLEPDVQQVVRLPYLNAVCNETLRLHTLLAEVGRVVLEPMKLANLDLERGTGLMISVMAIHHDPELYPEPEKFNPDRFIDRNYSPFEFLPFGGGHRRCLGSGLSDFEMRITLAEIVGGWDFESLREEVEIRNEIAMGPKYKVPLRIIGPRARSKTPAEEKSL